MIGIAQAAVFTDHGAAADRHPIERHDMNATGKDHVIPDLDAALALGFQIDSRVEHRVATKVYVAGSVNRHRPEDHV